MKLFWKFYAALFFAIVLSNALELLNKNSVMGVYYYTTIIFSSWYIIPYLLNILNTLLGGIVLVFILKYAFDLRPLIVLPAWLFYLRIICECTGHSYEWNFIQSEFAQGKVWGFVSLASLIIPILPSYYAQWIFTFKKSEGL